MQRKRKSTRKDPSNYHRTMLEQETQQREESNDRSREKNGERTQERRAGIKIQDINPRG
jgi:hypothetical protein